MTKVDYKAITLILGLIAFSFLFVWYVFAWTEPSAVPPGDNVKAPLNVGPIAQAKEGMLWLAYNPGVPIGLIVEYGKVGIGTTNPGNTLTILSPGMSGGSNGVTLSAVTGAQGWDTAFYRFGHDGGGMNRGLFYNSAAGRVSLWNDQERLSIASSGNVGIGETGPSYKLDVAGALRLQPGSAPTGANGVMYYDSGTNKFRCYVNGAWADCGSGAGGGF